MKAVEFIRDVTDESTRLWAGPDLPPERRFEMKKLAHHLRGCYSCRKDFDVLMESTTDLSGISLDDWVCDRKVQDANSGL